MKKQGKLTYHTGNRFIDHMISHSEFHSWEFVCLRWLKSLGSKKQIELSKAWWDNFEGHLEVELKSPDGEWGTIGFFKRFRNKWIDTPEKWKRISENS